MRANLNPHIWASGHAGYCDVDLILKILEDGLAVFDIPALLLVFTAYFMVFYIIVQLPEIWRLSVFWIV